MEEIFFDQPIRRSIKACENIREIATGQGDDYTTKLIVYQIILILNKITS